MFWSIMGLKAAIRNVKMEICFDFFFLQAHLENHCTPASYEEIEILNSLSEYLLLLPVIIHLGLPVGSRMLSGAAAI